MEDRSGKKLRIPEKLPGQIKEWLMRKDRLAILLLGGILLLVIALPVSEKEDRDSDGQDVSKGSFAEKAEGEEEDYASYLEEKLADVLSEVEGVGKVRVMITLESSGEKIIEKDVESERESVEESDSQGGTRSTTSSLSSQSTVYSGGEGDANSSEPYVTKELTPAVEGVVVIAGGGASGVVVQNITEAVQALFEIDTHKIKVMKGN